MSNYNEILKANREEIIELINDAIQFTNVSLKDAMTVIANNGARFSDLLATVKDEKYFTKEYNAFKSLVNEVVNNLSNPNASNASFQDMDEANRAQYRKNHL